MKEFMPHHARTRVHAASGQLAALGAAAACVGVVQIPLQGGMQPQDPRDSKGTTRLPERGAAVSATGPVASL